MIIRRQIADVWFEWDQRKSAECERERKFNFAAAAHVFFDEHALAMHNFSAHDEERFQVIGRIPIIGLTFVVFALREHNGETSYRIISTRKATKSEEIGLEKGY
jgi:uncharacterized DUF497 family protein